MVPSAAVNEEDIYQMYPLILLKDETLAHQILRPLKMSQFLKKAHLLTKMNTMVSMRTVLGTSSTGIAGFVMQVAVFIQDAVVMCLL